MQRLDQKNLLPPLFKAERLSSLDSLFFLAVFMQKGIECRKTEKPVKMLTMPRKISNTLASCAGYKQARIKKIPEPILNLAVICDYFFVMYPSR
jgi:hypothetical protein